MRAPADFGSEFAKQSALKTAFFDARRPHGVDALALRAAEYGLLGVERIAGAQQVGAKATPIADFADTAGVGSHAGGRVVHVSIAGAGGGSGSVSRARFETVHAEKRHGRENVAVTWHRHSPEPLQSLRHSFPT